jgi:lysophospholipase L1-like esterase
MSGTFSTSAVYLWAVAIGASTAVAARAEEPSDCHPEVWRDAIAAFEKQDEKEAPPKEGIVFVGSSSIRGWELKESFPDLPVINRGFGGSQICDAVHYAEVLVIKHQPRVVVLYAGDNDISEGGKKPEQVHRDFRAFARKVRKALPKTRLVFISIKPSIARWKVADKMREANKLIAADCEKEDDGMVFVDVWGPMLGEDGRPRKELLQDDNLHLNAAGYELWTKLLRPHLELTDEKANHDDTTITTKDK